MTGASRSRAQTAGTAGNTQPVGPRRQTIVNAARQSTSSTRREEGGGEPRRPESEGGSRKKTTQGRGRTKGKRKARARKPAREKKREEKERGDLLSGSQWEGARRERRARADEEEGRPRESGPLGRGSGARSRAEKTFTGGGGSGALPIATFSAFRLFLVRRLFGFLCPALFSSQTGRRIMRASLRTPAHFLQLLPHTPGGRVHERIHTDKLFFFFHPRDPPQRSRCSVLDGRSAERFFGARETA